MLTRASLLWSGLAPAVLFVAACQSPAAPVNPQDPEIIRAVESMLDRAVASAMAADAEGALSVTTKDDDFIFISGDAMLRGYDQALAAFRETYALIDRQTSQVIESHARVLAPDVVLVSAISEGTYTDKAGFTSAPVGLGSTIVFVRRDGQWQVIHFHQSVAKPVTPEGGGR